MIWASTQENLSSLFANNKGADQPAHIRWLESDRADMLSVLWTDRACSLGRIDPQSREAGGLVLETLALMSVMTAAGSSKSQLFANIHCIRTELIFLFLNQNIWCGYSKEQSH